MIPYWKRVPMGNLCSIESGKSNTQDAVENGLYTFFDRSKTPKKSSRYLYDCEALIIPGEGTEFLPRYFAGKFDLHQRAYALFDFSSQIDVRYLYYYLTHYKEWFVRQAVGATVKSLRRRHFTDLSVIVPPLSAQNRIVAILDEAFAGIGAATANTNKNLVNAREMFDCLLHSIFTRKGEAWINTKLGDIASVQSGGTPLRSVSEYWSGTIPWYSSGELNSLYTRAPERHITVSGLAGSNAKLLPAGSLLIGMYDTAALKMSVLDRPAAFNQAVSGVRPNDKVNLLFVRYAINAMKAEILSRRRGVRQKNLSLGKIKDIVISMPGISEQERVVQQLIAVEKDVQRLMEVGQRKIAALDSLKQSILQKAFAGELTGKEAERELAAA